MRRDQQLIMTLYHETNDIKRSFIFITTMNSNHIFYILIEKNTWARVDMEFLFEWLN